MSDEENFAMDQTQIYVPKWQLELWAGLALDKLTRVNGLLTECPDTNTRPSKAQEMETQ